jgi:hypothetical protein
MTWSFKSGDRVRVGGGFFGAFVVGTLVAQRRKFGRPSWSVRLERRFLFRSEINAFESTLAPLVPNRDWMVPGQAVVITWRPMRGATGTLLRRARLLWKRVWLVKLDQSFGGLRRTRIADEFLLPKSNDPSS